MYAENNGVKIWYEVHGRGEPTLVMVHGFQVSHSDVFKRPCVPFLSRHLRVVTLDLRGNGRSDRPEGGYDLDTYVQDVHTVVEAAGLDRFSMAGVALGVPIVINYQAKHPGRADQLILLNGFARLARSERYPQGIPWNVLEGALRSWKAEPEARLKKFIPLCYTEKYSLRGQELFWGWAHTTSPGIWELTYRTIASADVVEYLERIDVPTLIIQGQEDKMVLPSASGFLHQNISGSELILIPDAGHGFFRTWPQVNRHILNFLKPYAGPESSGRGQGENPKILWISSPVGLGHVKRDLTIAGEMRKQMPELTIHWLSVDPVRSLLEAVGEEIHPLSDALWNETDHFESHATDYSLDATEALWEMDKLLLNNFMVFTDAIREDGYDLVVGDESWEVVENLHYNPGFKTAPFVFMTDFIGASNVSEDPTKQAHVHNFNGTWVEMREVHPEVSDLSLFLGALEDIPDTSLGDRPPNRREWAEEHFECIGYVLPFDPAEYDDRQTLRAELGFSPEDKVLLVAVGGTSVGRPLIEKCLAAQESLRDTVPGIRTVVLCGPRIDPQVFGTREGVAFRQFAPDPIKLYAACDLAVVQGGLSTTMELTALNRPFLYFPLKDHFEQQECVPQRLGRYEAGIRMDFDQTSPAQLVEAIAANIGAPVNYRPVNTDGAKKAASRIIDLLKKERSS
jgi:pimeloyl-ACP methyl ester carboxylesterase/predicted glycosyltransferase